FRHVFLLAGRPDGRGRPARFLQAVRLRPDHRHRSGRRATWRAAFTRMEAQGLQEARAAALVPGRDRVRHRGAGLQRLHAAAAGAGDFGAGQRRRLHETPPGAPDHRSAHRPVQLPGGRAAIHHRSQARKSARDPRGHGGRRAQGHGATRLRGRGLPGGRQDRHGSGLQSARRQVQGARGGRAPARPCAVHGLRPGRGSADRGGPDRGKWRLGCVGGRADRAHGVRLLAGSGPRGAARAAPAGRAGSAQCPGRNAAGGFPGAARCAAGARRRRDARAGPPARRDLGARGRGPGGKPMKLIVLAVRRMFAVLDWPLLILLVIMAMVGMATMHSAVGNTDWRFADQLRNFLLAGTAMWAVALLRPAWIMRSAPLFYVLGVGLLVAVMLFGETSKGATRWLNLGIARIQPSEMMKIAVPLMLAWYFQRQSANRFRIMDFLVAGVLLVVPAGLIIDQPDLGTALLVLASGFCVIYFAGLSFRLLIPAVLAIALALGTLVTYED